MRGYLKYLMERELKSAAWMDEMKEQLKLANLQPKPVKTSNETGNPEIQNG